MSAAWWLVALVGAATIAIKGAGPVLLGGKPRRRGSDGSSVCSRPRCWRRSSPSARSEETARSSSTSARSGWEPRPSRWPSRRPRSSWWWSRRSSPPSRERSSRAVGFDPDDALPRPRVVRRLALPGADERHHGCRWCPRRHDDAHRRRRPARCRHGTHPDGRHGDRPARGHRRGAALRRLPHAQRQRRTDGARMGTRVRAPHHADRDHEHAQRRRRSRRARRLRGTEPSEGSGVLEPPRGRRDL